MSIKRILKWTGVGLGGVAAAALSGGLGVMAASEAMIRWPVAKPQVRMAAAADAGAVARGHRVATAQGCNDCHGANLQGKMFDDIPGLVKLYAPNLTLAVARQTDADLDRAIRHGVKSDGRALWVMPSSTFAHLTDAEVADLIAYLRAQKPAGEPQPRFKARPIARIGLLLGKFKSEPAIIAARENPALPDVGPRFALGRAVARACVECHGPALEGGGILSTPDLTIAAAYDPEDFRRLMRAGVAAGGRELKLMSPVARYRFGSLTDAEIAGLHAYLKARAEREIAAADTPAVSKR